LFESLHEWLKSGAVDELHTLDALKMWMIKGYVSIACTSDDHDSAAVSVSSEAVNTVKHLKRKLLYRYGEHILFAEVASRSNSVYLERRVGLVVSVLDSELGDPGSNLGMCTG
jgi:hypothetical protein